ncbi:MAG: head maturation protease, ClpP-related [Paenisporosarcina sp.]
MKNKPFWKFKSQVTNSTTNKAELLLYGPISETSWWDDEVTPRQFADDLANLGDIDELDIRINSGGGDVFAAHAIHNLIRSHKAKVNVIIDGLAASAATIIAMAGDVIKMPKNSVMMIHNPWTMTWGESKDLIKTAELLETVKDSIIAAYQIKTSLNVDEISALMDEESWMSAEKAFELGFADEVLENFQANASLNGSTLILNSIEHDLSRFKNSPNLKNFEGFKINQNTQTAVNTVKEAIKDMDMEKLKTDYPELYNQVMNDGKEQGIQAERSRIKDIENISVVGSDEIINAAKFDSGISAADTAMEILKAQKNQGAEFLNKVKKDALIVNTVQATPEATPDEGEAEEEYLDRVVNMAGKSKGVK